MKAAKSEGGLSRGGNEKQCFWSQVVLTLSHFSDVNRRMDENVRKYAALHRDLAKKQMKRDAQAVELALKWFEDNMPFDIDRNKKLLMSVSTEFTRTRHDSVSAEKAAEVGREMHIHKVLVDSLPIVPV